MQWQQHLRIILAGPRNPLNIGAAARAMLNFGFGELWLVDPYPPAFREARSAVGAQDVLRRAKVTSDLAEALGESSLVVATSALRARSEPHVRRLLPDGAPALRTHLATRPAALVFGSEKFGLSSEQLSFCDWILTIPTGEDCPSMNLGQSVALCCYEIARRARPVPALQTPATADAAQRERIVEMLTPILEAGGYLLPNTRGSQLKKVRRWVGRLRLAPDDARMMQGMLRQVRWKVEHP